MSSRSTAIGVLSVLGMGVASTLTVVGGPVALGILAFGVYGIARVKAQERAAKEEAEKECRNLQERENLMMPITLPSFQSFPSSSEFSPSFYAPPDALAVLAAKAPARAYDVMTRRTDSEMFTSFVNSEMATEFARQGMGADVDIQRPLFGNGLRIRIRPVR